MITLVIAPHPDDEVLGVGGTLLRRKQEGATIGWLIMTNISEMSGWSSQKVEQRKNEIARVTEFFGFDKVVELGFATTKLDLVPMGNLVEAVSDAIKAFAPTEIFLPHFSDIHSDHRLTFEAVASATKWFRCPSVKRLLAYETLSETNFGLEHNQKFQPNIFMNITDYLEGKLKAMSIYSSELGAFPFPRSHEAIASLAAFRGSSSGFKAAEAFELLRETI
jgi:LmbE family N-acetylglucosaminyl deacetylase